METTDLKIAWVDLSGLSNEELLEFFELNAQAVARAMEERDSQVLLAVSNGLRGLYKELHKRNPAAMAAWESYVQKSSGQGKVQAVDSPRRFFVEAHLNA